MNLTTARNQDVSIVRVNETRLMYPILGEFANTITSLIGSGERKVLLDLSTVTYVDSARRLSLDLYRQSARRRRAGCRRPESCRDDADDSGAPELSSNSPTKRRRSELRAYHEDRQTTTCADTPRWRLLAIRNLVQYPPHGVARTPFEE